MPSGSRDLGYGLYYFENLGGTFAPGQLIYQGSTPFKAPVNGNTLLNIANHNTGPEVVDFDSDGKPDLLVGTESGRIFYFHRSYIERDVPPVAIVSEE